MSSLDRRSAGRSGKAVRAAGGTLVIVGASFLVGILFASSWWWIILLVVFVVGVIALS